MELEVDPPSNIRRSTRVQPRFAALAHPSFRWFTLAGMLWMMGDNIEHVISYWVIFDEFESQMLGGYAVISHWAPFLLLGIYMGAVADRHDARKLFLISMGMFAFVSLAWSYLFWTETLAIWHAMALLTIHGLAGVIFMPASQLIIHDMVEDADVPSAVRLTATSRQLGLVLGPAVGGTLLLLLGPAVGMAINAIFYIPVIAWALTAPYTGHSHGNRATQMPRGSSWGFRQVFVTLREASASPTILAMVLLVGLTSLLVGNAYTAQLPEFSRSFVGQNQGIVYTVLQLAPAMGAIIGGVGQEGLRLLRPTPLKAIFIAGLWALTMVIFAAAPSYVVALVALFFSGMLLLSFTSMAQALIQLEAPAASRGRMLGVFNMSFNGLRIGSGMTVGFLGAVIGIHWSLGLSAVALLLAVIALALYVRRASARRSRQAQVSVLTR